MDAITKQKVSFHAEMVRYHRRLAVSVFGDRAVHHAQEMQKHAERLRELTRQPVSAEPSQ